MISKKYLTYASVMAAGCGWQYYGMKAGILGVPAR
jgi:hypothetical protein